MSALVLKLTDGTTTLDLNDITNYAIPDQVWVPKVATRRISQLGGRSLYNDVTENIPLHVRGATPAAALANLQAVSELLDQAELWFNGGLVDPVVLQYKPINSSLTNPVEAIVLGPGSSNSMLRLSPQVNSAGNYEIQGITVAIKRRGLWLGDTDTQTSSTATMPAVQSVTMSNNTAVSTPTKVKATVSGTGLGVSGKCILFMSSLSNGIYLAESSDLSGTTPVSSSQCSGGSYVELGVNSSVTTYTDTTITMNADAKHFAVYAMMHNPDTIDYLMTVNNAPQIRIEPTTSGPQLFFVGSFSSAQALSTVYFRVQPDGTITSKLQMDYYVLVAMSPHTSVVGLPSISLASSGDYVEIDHQYLDAISPSCSNGTFTGSPFFNSRDNGVSVLFAGAGDGRWSMHQTTKWNVAVEVERQAGFLVPD